MGKWNPSNNSNAYQVLTGVLPGGVWSKPSYFNNTVYYGGVSDHLKAFGISNAMLTHLANLAERRTRFLIPERFR